MVQKVTLFDNNLDRLLRFNNVVIDVTQNETVIHKKFEIVVLPLTVSAITVKNWNITVLYTNDYSLTILPFKC